MRNVMRQMRSLGRRQTGLSLLELLVAVLVTAIGVLGVTSLQMLSLQGNRLALQRNEAVLLAYDIMDRIRANPGGAYGVAVGDAPVAPTNCVTTNCAAAAITTFDESIWKCTLGGFRGEAVCTDLVTAGVIPAAAQQPGLPAGDGSITVAGGVVTVVVQWNDTSTGQTVSVTIASQT